MTDRTQGISIIQVVIVALAFCLLMGLGIWQLQRLDEKTAILTAIDQGLSADAVALPPAISDPTPWNYRPVTLEGRFDHDHELYFHTTSVDGKAGYHILTPLVRDHGDTVLVDRGWVPPTHKDPATRADGQISGPVHVTGITRVPRKGGVFVPDPDVRGNLWFQIDIPAMAAATGLELMPIVVDAAREPVNPGGLPVGGQTRLDIPNNHLDYAFTWFGLGLTLIVIYVVYLRRRR